MLLVNGINPDNHTAPAGYVIWQSEIIVQMTFRHNVLPYCKPCKLRNIRLMQKFAWILLRGAHHDGYIISSQ
jgi:hypothetical protein